MAISFDAEDVRYVELTGHEPKRPSPDGHIMIDVLCPFHGGDAPSCRLHFGLDGGGRFFCRPCLRAGLATYQEDDGRRMVTLAFNGEFVEHEVTH